MCFCFLSRLLVSSHEGWYQSCMGRNKRIHKNATELCYHIMASGNLRQNNDVEKDHYYLFRCDKWLHSSWSCCGNYWFHFVWPVLHDVNILWIFHWKLVEKNTDFLFLNSLLGHKHSMNYKDYTANIFNAKYLYSFPLCPVFHCTPAALHCHSALLAFNCFSKCSI